MASLSPQFDIYEFLRGRGVSDMLIEKMEKYKVGC